ncbi:SMI1/KNR4 family protein [Amycolatopsis samaneae]|uniref:SMI1/KNR4 family protein n=1 Tax=Amycolatopsis samaneae TaxID=664691 RepID=A0ABW5GDK0_9PSEU
MKIATLAAKLDRLRVLEDGRAKALGQARGRREAFAVFGADGHGYRSRPLSGTEIAAVEAALGVALPPGYRDFLCRVGAGAGPYYGLLGMADLVTEPEDRDPAGDFPFTRADADRLHREWRDWLREPDSGGGPAAAAAMESPGCIAIGRQGCAGQSMLVTTGELAGSVWDNWEDTWRPARNPTGVSGLPLAPVYLGPVPDFLAWYDGWLTGALAQLGARS